MLEKLSSNQGVKSDEPNIALAHELTKSKDKQGIIEIVSGLNSKDKGISSDCIKVLYEIGYMNPELIMNFANDFIHLLTSKNNRLVWGSMIALSTIAELNPNPILENWDIVYSAYENGSVITIDNSITVFAKLCNINQESYDRIFPILIQHLKTCRPKEVPQHAERMLVCINKDNKKEFLDVLNSRIIELTPPQNARIKKIEKSINTQKNQRN